MCLGVFCLGFILFWTLWISWTWVAISFPILGNFSTIISSSIFLMSFLFVFFFWDNYDLNVEVFTIVSEDSEIVLIFLLLLLFFSLPHLFPPFYLPSHLSSLLPQFFYCWLPPEYFSSQLLHCSLLIDSSLFLLGPY